MQADIQLDWIAAVLLCSLRMTPALVLSPVFGGFQVAAKIKAMLVLAWSACLVSSGTAVSPAIYASTGALLGAAFSEIVFGALFAFGILTAFAAFDFAGKLLDVQIGFGLGAVFDPVTRRPSPLFGSMLGMLSVVCFFALDLHLLLLRGFAYSLEKVPLGMPHWTIAPEALIWQFGTVFTLGLGLAAPVVFLLFLADAGLAVLSKSVPQLNILFLGTPVKVIIGLAMLAFIATGSGGAIGRVLRSGLEYAAATL